MRDGGKGCMRMLGCCLWTATLEGARASAIQHVWGVVS
jgi:hypothetical protein